MVPVLPSILARTDDTALAVTHLKVYRSGFLFTLSARLRTLDGLKLSGDHLHSTFWLGRWITFTLVNDAGRHDERFVPGVVPDLPPPAVMRLGVRYADGRIASNLDEWPAAAERERIGMVLTIDGLAEKEKGRQCDLDCWVRPLPPPGLLTLILEWPARGIPETTRQLDSTLLRAAAGRSIRMWEVNDGD